MDKAVNKIPIVYRMTDNKSRFYPRLTRSGMCLKLPTICCKKITATAL